MKLRFQGHDHRYAVEQMVTMLLPGDPISMDGPNEGLVTLDRDRATADFTIGGGVYHGQAELSEFGLDVPADRPAQEQRLVKMATYRALIQHTGKPAWGALSGVRPAKLVRKWLEKGADSPQCAQLLTGLYDLDRDKAILAIRCAQEAREIDRQLESGDLSVYIGIPFCPSRCAYCSFISHDVKGALALVEPYVDALEREIAWTGDYLARKGLRLRSVYMGGGTPTTLSAQQLDRLLTALDRWPGREALAEFTVEAGRPDTITAEKLAVLKSHGVGRVSVNPQTLSDDVLQAMGRAHTAGQFFDAYDRARSAGFEAINTDLIAGLPQDSEAGFRSTLDKITALRPEEITIHTLALKHGAGLASNPQGLPSAGEVTAMLTYAAQVLPAAGYRPYYLYRQKYMTGAMENLGWTRRGKASFYNIVMMEELGSVLALGSGGVTKLIDRSTGSITRRTNPKYPKEYLERLADILAEREALVWPVN